MQTGILILNSSNVQSATSERNLEKGKTIPHQREIELSKKGNRKAQHRLYQAYAGGMYNVARRLLNNDQDAEDALQESFIKAFKNLGNYRYESTFDAWLKRIVINTSVNMLRKRRIEIVPVEHVGEVQVETQEESMSGFDIKKVKAAFELLPQGYKRILSLYLLEGFDHQEISEIAGISVSTSKSQFHRAKRKLAELTNRM